MGLAVVFEALLGSEPANSWSQPTPLPSPLSSTHTCPSVERVGIPKHATASLTLGLFLCLEPGVSSSIAFFLTLSLVTCPGEVLPPGSKATCASTINVLMTLYCLCDQLD